MGERVVVDDTVEEGEASGVADLAAVSEAFAVPVWEAESLGEGESPCMVGVGAAGVGEVVSVGKWGLAEVEGVAAPVALTELLLLLPPPPPPPLPPSVEALPLPEAEAQSEAVLERAGVRESEGLVLLVRVGAALLEVEGQRVEVREPRAVPAEERDAGAAWVGSGLFEGLRVRAGEAEVEGLPLDVGVAPLRTEAVACSRGVAVAAAAVPVERPPGECEDGGDGL